MRVIFVVIAFVLIFFSFFSCFPMTPSDRRFEVQNNPWRGRGLLGGPAVPRSSWDPAGWPPWALQLLRLVWDLSTRITQPTGQVVSLWFSRPHSLPVVWINAVPGDVDTCWPDPWGQVTLWRWVLLTWGEFEWLTQRQKSWYPVTNPLIQPNPHLFPPYPLFFFFF